MKARFLHILVALGFVTLAAGLALAQKYARPEYNECIRAYYDPNMYNWLTFENTCNLALSVTIIWRNPPYGAGTLDIRPGGHAGTGNSREEVNHHGGYLLYVCPDGYAPVESDGRTLVRRPVNDYVCEKIR